MTATLLKMDFEGLEALEPLFGSMALYDMTTRAQVSETFYVSGSDPALIAKLNGRAVGLLECVRGY